MTIKTFRGQIVDGGQDTIVLHTNDGSIGYRIVKFELFPPKPGEVEYRSLVQIFKIEQATVPTDQGTSDFNDNTLLAAGFLAIGAGLDESASVVSVFDNEIFNQDIYVTHTQQAGSEPMNYYIELEKMELDLSQNTVATLKDIRNVTTPT